MGDDIEMERGDDTMGAAIVADGIARFGGVVAQLPAGSAAALRDAEEGRIARMLGRGWDLAAFTPTGALVLEVLDAAGARVELVAGVPADWGRRRVQPASGGGGRSLREHTSHAPAVAAWGAPPGRRVSAMALVPGPDGEQVRASCALVLRLPAAAVDGVVRVAWMLAWHAAMHAAERRSFPSGGRLAGALDALELELGVPRGPRGRVAWADSIAARVVEEIGLAG